MKWTAAVGVLLLALVVAWLAIDAPRNGVSAPESATETELPIAEGAPSFADRPANANTEASRALDAAMVTREGAIRIAAPAAKRLPGMVRWSDGSPCWGAIVSLTALVRDLPGDSSWWYEVPWPRVRARTVRATTDEQGNFAFDELPSESSNVRSALWVTHDGASAKVAIVGPFAVEQTGLVDVELDRAPQWCVRVIDESGSAVADADVLQFAIRGRERVGTGSDYDLAHRMFFRDGKTDEDGLVAGAPMHGTLGLVASRGRQRSRPWFGMMSSSDEIVLTLHRQFTLSGVVRGCTPNEDDEPMNVLCASVRGTSSAQLGAARVRSDGTFGPIELPLAPADHFDLYLEGGGCQAIHLVQSPPPPGEPVWVEIVTAPGIDFVVDVVDSERRPIAGAEVTVNWDRDGTVSRVSGRANADGRFVARGCRPGIVRLATSTTGFRSEYETLSIPLADGRPYVVELEPGATVDVKVTHAGKPVASFDLIFEGVHPPSPMGRSTVVDSVDGFCRIDDAPIGSMYIIAISSEFPRSEPITVQTNADTATSVEIELPAPLMGRGRVLDAITRQPVNDAWIQVYSNKAGMMLLPWGPKFDIDADGRFEVSGFAPGDTCCKVGAPGYSDGFGRAIGVLGKGAELGELLLTRLQPLSIRIVGNDGVDPTRFYAYAQGTITLERRSFDSSGIVRWDDVGNGRLILSITDDSQYIDSIIDLVPGRTWDFAFPVGSGSALRVELDQPRDQKRIAWYARATPEVVGVQRAVFDRFPNKDGAVLFRGLPTGSAMIEIYEDGASQPIAIERVNVVQDEQTLQVRLDAKQLHLRVVDKHRSPIVGAEVCLHEQPSTTGWQSCSFADSDGWVRWSNLNLDSVNVHLYHASIGSRSGLNVALERDVSEIEFVLEADAHVRVRAMDGATVLSGVPVEICDASGSFNYGVFAGDGDGYSESRAVHEGSYLVLVRTPSVWPFEARINAREDDGYDVLQLRRRGGLELTVLDVGGARVANASVNLVSTEFHSSVADWLARGLCTSSSTALTTDSQGLLIIDGLPRGDFTWSCGTTTGTVTVQPLARTSKHLRLQ